jgi:hypothetical protein
MNATKGRRKRKKGSLVPAPMWGWAYNKNKEDGEGDGTCCNQFSHCFSTNYQCQK